MKNGRGPEYEEITLASGVMVKVLPFPLMSFERIQRESFEKFPDAEPPMKTIKVVDGTEEVEDTNSPEYLKEQEQIEKQREEWQSRELLATLFDFCLEIDLDKYKAQINRLKKRRDDWPDDPFDQQQQFLSEYGIRKKTEYEELIFSSLSQSMIGDSEVSGRIRSFRSEMEGAAGLKVDASGTNEEKRLEVESESS